MHAYDQYQTGNSHLCESVLMKMDILIGPITALPQSPKILFNFSSLCIRRAAAVLAHGYNTSKNKIIEIKSVT